jgi:UDP-N-acetylmuramoyl-L-alanyl-D-glutamate--2,6-diaminopimelate ligase
MRFADLISKVPSVQREGSADAEVTAIADDSRKVGPGTLFVARGGARADGGAFVADAIKRGAVAIVAAPGVAVPANMPVARAVHPSLSAAHLAHAFHGFPAQQLRVAWGSHLWFMTHIQL